MNNPKNRPIEESTMFVRTLKTFVTIALFAGLAASLGACGDAASDSAMPNESDNAGAPPDDFYAGCEAGTGIMSRRYNEPFCLIPRKRGITEEGFQCPNELMFVAAYGNLDICGPDDRLPDPIREAAKQLVNRDYIPDEQCSDRFCTEQGSLCTPSGNCKQLTDQRRCIVGCAGGFEQDTADICAMDGSTYGRCRIECDDAIQRAENANMCSQNDNGCDLEAASAEITAGSTTITYDPTAAEPNDVEVAPGQEIRLTGIGELDSAQIDWSLTSKPDASKASLETSDSSSATFYADVAGLYQVELTRQSSSGDCQATTTIPVRVVPASDSIYAELTWTNQVSSCTSNLDLHYVHPNGNWNEPPLDIFEDNPTSDFGESGSDDDPQLEVGSPLSETGLERLNHPNPDPQGPYRIGVYYRSIEPTESNAPCSTQDVTADARIRIYMQGKLIHEGMRSLSGPDEFWEIGRVQWSVDRVDEIRDGFPE
jgi:hypothetical protein